MKPILSFAAFAALATPFLPAFALARNSLEGRWKNGAMEIVIAPCGGETLCGRVVKASNKQQEKAERGSGTHLLGFQVIDNIRPAGPRSWSAHVFLASPQFECSRNDRTGRT